MGFKGLCWTKEKAAISGNQKSRLYFTFGMVGRDGAIQGGQSFILAESSISHKPVKRKIRAFDNCLWPVSFFVGHAKITETSRFQKAVIDYERWQNYPTGQKLPEILPAVEKFSLILRDWNRNWTKWACRGHLRTCLDTSLSDTLTMKPFPKRIFG